jgi:tetratricopeptide (TPR) repeat protein
LYTHKDLEKSLFYFTLNTESYPESSNAFDGLAEFYKAKGDKTNAIKYYKQALLLNPNNENSKEKLSELTEK